MKKYIIYQSLLLALFYEGFCFAQTEIISNGNFLAGTNSWNLSLNFYHAGSQFTNCNSCPGYTYVGKSDGTPGDNLVGSMYQSISIPSNATTVILRFWYYITTQESGTSANDILNVTLQNSNGNFLASVITLSNLNKDTWYKQTNPFDVTAYKGQTIRVHFLGTTNATNPTTFRIDDVSMMANVCSYSINPLDQQFTASGGNGIVNVSAGSGCTWTATSNNSTWITITSGSSGNGNGTVNYSVAPYTGTNPRSGTMTIAGKTFTVNQNGVSCNYSINPPSQSFTATGGNGTVNVTAGNGCSWTAISNNSTWITIVSGSTGNGPGTVNYNVATYTGTILRSGTITIAGNTFTVNQDGVSSQNTYDWPVDNPTITQTYSCRGCLSNFASGDRYDHGISIHTGTDVVGIGSPYTIPVKACSDGWIENKVAWNANSRGLGNTIIMRHSNGKYSLYGHLDSFNPNLTINQFVIQGTQLGIMGNSSSNAARDNSFGIHVHFEIKVNPTLGNISNVPGEGYVGYTPGHPDLYSYYDPKFMIQNISPTSITPIVILNPPPGSLNIRGNPGTTYFESTSTSIIGKFGEGQKVVARRKVNVDGIDWYFIDMASRNTPIESSPHPNNGVNGGWVSGEFAIGDPTGLQVEVIASPYYRIRSGAGTGTDIIALGYTGQRFVMSGNPTNGDGCAEQWYPVYITGSKDSSLPPTTGWICGDGIQIITKIPNDYNEKPSDYFLGQNFPNPFNPSTTISYSLPETEFVTLKIYDLLGREIITLVNEEISPGNYSVEFDGSELASGTYIYRIQTTKFSTAKKFILMK